ncbi:hypothetical protein COO60DRAFT_1699898 [Scenedesmus sp. NREL 46B-D3]|nr:hypothetical protein COO60DRAFT_1699898 [Scenedesmus sp. NREL 46B-D3]
MSAAAASGAAADDNAEQLFVDADLERTRKLPQYTTSSPTVQQQQQQQQQQAADSSSTAWQYLAPECDAAANTCSNWGLTHSKTIELWQDLGPQLFPLPNISRKGMLIDTGVEPRQFNVLPQLAANQSITYSRDGNSPPDGQLGMGHGTHVFGIMAAGHGPFRRQDDPSRTAGIVGPAAQAVASCNCFGRYQEGRDGDVVACIAHAVETGTHWVVNLSLGDEGSRDDTAHKLYYDTLTEFCAAGGIAVIAAGNGVCVGGCEWGNIGPRSYVGVDVSNAGLQPDGVTVKPNIASYPAVMAEYFPDCVITVANIDAAGQLVAGSNFGAAVRIAAPGTDIVSAWPVFGSGNTWQSMSMSGTSMSSPHVAGAALLLRNAFPDATNTQVVRCLISGSSKQPAVPDAGRALGGGMLDVRAAYACLAVEMQQEPPFNCRVQEVPPCVDASSGVRDDGCAEPYFCLTFDQAGSAIRPPLGSSTSGSAADGSSHSVRPALLLNGTQFLAQSCSTTVAVGSACNATCIPGWQGGGYSVTCLPDGTWSLPAGGGCRELPVISTVCGACRAGQACAAAIPAWVQLVALAITAAWLAAEVAFYLVWYLPAYRRHNARCNAHKSPAAQSTDECHALFKRFMAFSRSQPCQLEFLQQYLSTWFRGADPQDIKRGNMEELFAYGFFYRTRAELEALGLGHLPSEMTGEFEGVFDMKFPPGYNADLKFMSHLWDDLRVSWRPLGFYAAMEGLAMLAAAALWVMGFKKHRLGDDSSSKQQPIVFIHGVAGLLLYLPLLGRLASCKAPMLLLDMKHVGLRISSTIPTVDDLATALAAALLRHNLPPALLVAHSYGTLVAGRLLRLQRRAVARVLFVDPVCFGMFMPRLLHGFIYAPLRVQLGRPLHSAFNLLLWLVSKDVHLAATFARKFYWTDLNLWPEDLPEGSSVVLSGADALVSAADIHKMLSSSGVQVVYKPDLIHGGFMLDHTTRGEVLASVQNMAQQQQQRPRAAACAATNSSSSGSDAEPVAQPDFRRRSFCTSSFSSSRLPAVQEWDVASNTSSSNHDSGSSVAAAAEDAADVAAAAAAATVATAAAAAAQAALIATAASPRGLLGTYCPEVVEWQQQPIMVERRSTVH